MIITKKRSPRRTLLRGWVLPWPCPCWMRWSRDDGASRGRQPGAAPGDRVRADGIAITIGPRPASRVRSTALTSTLSPLAPVRSM